MTQAPKQFLGWLRVASPRYLLDPIGLELCVGLNATVTPTLALEHLQGIPVPVDVTEGLHAVFGHVREAWPEPFFPRLASLDRADSSRGRFRDHERLAM